MKSAFVAVVGRPSSGKSTLLNALCGHKVSIVSPVPQTTRNQIRGIVHRPEGQLVFLDTPGFHLSDRKLNLSMMDLVTRSLHDADLVVYLVDSTREAGPEERALIERLATLRKPLVAVLNKTDVVSASKATLGQEIQVAMSPRALLEISALQNRGLDKLLATLFELAPEGQAFYPEDHYTDQDARFRVAELVREQAIARTTSEIPHALYVDVADMEVREAPPVEGAKPQPTLWLRVFLIVERESQVGILVGKGGAKIKEIRQAAQKEIGKVFSQRIHLDLRCKADPKWRSNDTLLKSMLGLTRPH